jgi:hypothetical protein
MTQSFEDDETDELGYYTFGVHDHIEAVTSDVEQAVHDLEDREIEQFCVAIRAKIADVLRDVRRRQQLDSPAPEPEERDPADRWWDR